MTHPLIGTIQEMEIKDKTTDFWQLHHSLGNAYLPTEGITADEHATTLPVFLYKGKDESIMATTKLPTLEIGTFGWGAIQKMDNQRGAFVDVGTIFNILLPKDDLPAVEAVWPIVGDELYVRMKKDGKGGLLLLPAKEDELEDLYADASQVALNDHLEGRIMQVGKEGSVIVTEEGYRGFIHHSERDKEPRLGSIVSGRVIEVKEDGTLNVSLLPLKQDRMDDDAAKIFAYLEAHDGIIPIGNKSDAELIINTFGMSKSAFKRAVGRLYKEKKVIPEDEQISQVQE